MNKHMVILLVVMAICLLFSPVVDNRQNKKLCVILVSVLLALFCGLRSWWMGDLIKYYTLYRNCNLGGMTVVFQEISNFAIRLFFYITGRLGFSYDFDILLIAVFSSVALGCFVFKYSPSPYWSYLIYIAMGFYMFTYSGLKQTIAMGFLFYAADGILQSKPLKFFIWTFVAGCFHAPAFIFLPAYIVAKQRFNQRYLLILGLVTVGIFLFRNNIVGIMSKAYYEDETKFAASGRIGGRTLMIVLIITMSAFLRPPRKGDLIYSRTFNLVIVAAMIQYFSMYNNVFTRLADYYFQFVVLFIPLMLENGDHQIKYASQSGRMVRVRVFGKNIYLLLGLGVTLFALLFYKNYLTGSAALLEHFVFFWEIDPYSLYGT